MHVLKSRKQRKTVKYTKKLLLDKNSADQALQCVIKVIYSTNVISFFVCLPKTNFELNYMKLEEKLNESK